LKGADVVILPGGFAYGDYLRAGALARFSPVMESVAAFAKEGGPVLGICNGFQVLLEAGLLPGAMQINRGLRYVCRDIHMKSKTTRPPFTSLYPNGSVVTMPVGHMEGNYTASPRRSSALERGARRPSATATAGPRDRRANPTAPPQHRRHPNREATSSA
jgi:phosphoribosylformylglycinamidine synthase